MICKSRWGWEDSATGARTLSALTDHDALVDQNAADGDLPDRKCLAGLTRAQEKACVRDGYSHPGDPARTRIRTHIHTA